MTDAIPVKRRDATSLGEFEAGDRAPMRFLQLPKGYIDGLKMEWLSANSLRVTSGAAYIPSLNRVVEVPGGIQKTGLSLVANAWHHVYLTESSGLVDIEVSTVEPSTPYSGTARVKLGDASRRYVGSVRANGSSAIIKFKHNPTTGLVDYLTSINGDGLHVASGLAITSELAISCENVAPITSRTVVAFAENSGGPSVVYVSNADVGSPPNSNILSFIRNGRVILGPLSLATDRTFSVSMDAGAIFDCWINGYYFER